MTVIPVSVPGRGIDDGLRSLTLRAEDAIDEAALVVLMQHLIDSPGKHSEKIRRMVDAACQES